MPKVKVTPGMFFFLGKGGVKRGIFWCFLGQREKISFISKGHFFFGQQKPKKIKFSFFKFSFGVKWGNNRGES